MWHIQGMQRIVAGFVTDIFWIEAAPCYMQLLFTVPLLYTSQV